MIMDLYCVENKEGLYACTGDCHGFQVVVSVIKCNKNDE